MKGIKKLASQVPLLSKRPSDIQIDESPLKYQKKTSILRELNQELEQAEVGGIDICDDSSECSHNNSIHEGEHDNNHHTNSYQENANEELLRFFQNYYSGDEHEADEDILSQHSFKSANNQFSFEENVDNIMKKVLKFTVNSSLSESSLKGLLELIKDVVQDVTTNTEREQVQKCLNLKEFYKYFTLNSKTRKIPMCVGCCEYKRNEGDKSCPKCKKLWSQMNNHCFLRPLKFQIEERLFREPEFLSPEQEIDKNNLSDDVSNGHLIKDRCDGVVYRKKHSEFVKNGGKTFTLFGDGVSPFSSSKSGFYQFSLTLNELKPHLRKKRKNSLLWILYPDGPGHDEIKLLMKILMDDLNYFNTHFERFKFRLERVVADLPARSEILFFKKSGYYFCHLCQISGKAIANSNNKEVVRYPIERNSLTNQRIISELRTPEFWDKVFETKSQSTYGMLDRSPILDQNWNPTPSEICCFDSMHNLYEGLFLDIFSSISTDNWQEFDEEMYGPLHAEGQCFELE